MYINAVCNGLDNLPKDVEIREELNQKYRNKGILSIQKQLQNIDPIQYKKIDINNPQRVIRALEVCLITNKPYSSLLNNNRKSDLFKWLNFYFIKVKNLWKIRSIKE